MDTPLNFLGSTEPAFLFVLHLGQIVVLLLALRYVDLYEREPFAPIIAIFTWGALGATVISLFGNGVFQAVLPPDVANVFGAAIAAPIVEELAKGLALVVAFLVANRASRRFGTLEFQGLTDGVIYGAAVGLGFAFTENIIYFFNFALQSGSFASGIEVFLLRADFTGLNVLGHALYTGLFGAGIGVATWKRGFGRVGWPLLGLVGAMGMHAIWNGLATLLTVRRFGFDTVAAALAGARLPTDLVDQLVASFESGQNATEAVYFVGLVAMAIAFAFWLRYERRILRYELAEEVKAGLLTQQEWELLPNFRRRQAWYWRMRLSGQGAHLRATKLLHDRLVDLGLQRWRIRNRGGDLRLLERDRGEVAALRQFVVTLAALEAPRAAAAPPQSWPPQPVAAQRRGTAG